MAWLCPAFNHARPLSRSVWQPHPYTFLKTKLTSPGASEALTELEKTPDDEDARTILHLKLKKLLTDDPQLRDELAALLRTLAPEAGTVTQTANTLGNENVTTQVGGSGNTVIVK